MKWIFLKSFEMDDILIGNEGKKKGGNDKGKDSKEGQMGRSGCKERNSGVQWGNGDEHRDGLG